MGAQKKLEHRLECLRQADEAARAEVERMLREDVEGLRENEVIGIENAGVGTCYVENENGKLVKQRASAGRKTHTRRRMPKAENAPRLLTPEDQERINRTTVVTPAPDITNNWCVSLKATRP